MAHTVVGIVELKDVVKAGIKARFAELRRMGIKTVMVTGDNKLTGRRPSPPRRAWTTSWPRPRPRPNCALIEAWTKPRDWWSP